MASFNIVPITAANTVLITIVSIASSFEICRPDIGCYKFTINRTLT